MNLQEFACAPVTMTSWSPLTLTLSQTSPNITTSCLTISSCHSCLPTPLLTLDSLTLCLAGGSLLGARYHSVTLYPHTALSAVESEALFSTTCSGSCPVCSYQSEQCLPDCAPGEFGGGCIKCDIGCAACFGPSNRQCFACSGG
jgi:hypothetical protein